MMNVDADAEAASMFIAYNLTMFSTKELLKIVKLYPSAIFTMIKSE